MSPIDRRGALALLGGGAALPLAARPASAPVAFEHGVASGDPTQRGAILWTRVTTPATRAMPVRWIVAEREGGSAIERGAAEARPARDFTVKVEARGLRPGRDYVYWFEAAGVRSPLGRFRTLPAGATDALVFAVASCQLFGNGHFNAHAAIAREPRLDAVLFLGDYIYEDAPLGYGGDNARRYGRIAAPDHEIVTLADYRSRHAAYKTDRDLQAAHARAAWICVWDDHEVANDDWTGGAENHQPATEGDWAARKAAAMQAYFEWMPIRDPMPGKPWAAINRSFEFGDLATLAMVETRLLARSRQADQVAPPTDSAGVARCLAERARPEREMLGLGQQAWLQATLAASVRAGKPWQLLGNQVIVARVPGPDVERLLGPVRAKAAIDALPAATAARVRASQQGFRLGLPYNLDSWDGYPAARERLYGAFRAAGSRPIVLSGDSHAFWANDLHDAAGRLAAVEFGTSAITSPSVGDSLPGLPLGEMLAAAAPEVRFCDQRAKGYIRLTLTREQATGDYVAVAIDAPAVAARTIARFATATDTRAPLRAVGSAPAAPQASVRTPGSRA